MKVIEEYLVGDKPHHHTAYEYIKCDYFCPSCGKQEVWENQTYSGREIGSSYDCTACGKRHYLDYCDRHSNPQVIEQLRTGITATSNSPLLGGMPK